MRKSRKQLRWLLDELGTDYDCIILDCPPNITLLSENVFRASNLILVPVIPTTLSERTLEQLFGFFAEMDLPSGILVPFFSMAQTSQSHPPGNHRAFAGKVPDVPENGHSLHGRDRKDGTSSDAGAGVCRNLPVAQAYRALCEEIQERLNTKGSTENAHGDPKKVRLRTR